MFRPKTLILGAAVVVALAVVLSLLGVLSFDEAARIGGSLIAFDALLTCGLWFAGHPHEGLDLDDGGFPADGNSERSRLELLLVGLHDRSNARAVAQMMIELSQGAPLRDRELAERLGQSVKRARGDTAAIRDPHFRRAWLDDLEETWKQN